MKLSCILIAGGGIGGLTAALCLAQRGFDVKVFEQSKALAEIGAGIQLSPNCTRVLHELGLEQALSDHVFHPEGAQFRNWRTAAVIGQSRLGEEVVKRYGAPYYHIHRGDLLRVLLDAVAKSDKIALDVDSEVTGFSQTSSRVIVSTPNGSHEGRALIGADGIHSKIRSQLWGMEKPDFTGNVAWRALVPTHKLPGGLIKPMSTAWWGPGKHFVHYYVRGGSLVNCVCVVEKTGWEVESWTEPGDIAELKLDFGDWHADIQQLISQIDADAVFKWALFDRRPMKHWGKGLVSLLGDACHPTLPFMAQGAAMAIEDAQVLADCLLVSADIEAGLLCYEELRRDRTAWIQNGSRRNAMVFHLSGVKAWLRNRAVATSSHLAMHRLFSYNPLDVVSQSRGQTNSVIGQ